MTENDYRLVLADLRLLRNMAANSTASPSIQAVLAYYSSAAQSTPHIGAARWQAFTDAEKRRCLILALEAIGRYSSTTHTHAPHARTHAPHAHSHTEEC